MLKYLTKFALDVLPSVVATILGAYIVNHYINTNADTPAATVASVVDPKSQKNDPKSADVAKIPEPGVKAKGISERAMIEKSASEGVAEVKPVDSKTAEVKPAESVSAPAEPRRAAPAREKAVAKATPALVTAAPVTAAPVAESNSTLEERRDANDLARAAIERLRGTTPTSQEAARQEASRPEANRQAERTVGVSPAPLRPLPPPIAVAAPLADGNYAGSPPYTASIRNVDPNRPTPPAEIPSPPLDLRAAANEPATAKERAKAVAEDMLSAAKSVFHTVLPQ